MVNKIMTTLQTRPYGKHTYKAAKLMRETMLLGGMLNNSESWINISQKDIKNLEKPDIMLQRKLLSESGNPSICFMNLELGILPVKYVLIKKRLAFLHYILNESMESLISKVFSALKEDCRRGDFVYQTNQDREKLNIILSNEEIKNISYLKWKDYINMKVKLAALDELNLENSTKEKTKNILFNKLEMRKYIQENKNTKTTKVIFSVRSQTLDIKDWLPWNYSDNMCVACGKSFETMNHFMVCAAYESDPFEEWEQINGEEYETILTIGNAVRSRYKERKSILAGQAIQADSNAPGYSS